MMGLEGCNHGPGARPRRVRQETNHYPIVNTADVYYTTYLKPGIISVRLI